MFTSTDQYGTSHMDIDWDKPPGVSCGTAGWVMDPNPGDSGSETIWGYIEAFGTGIADSALKDGELSFAEAVDYALDNDVMRLNACNRPTVIPDPKPTAIPHSCSAEILSPDLAIGVSAQLAAANGNGGQSTSSRSVDLELTVTNVTVDPASGPVPAATVKVYWARGPQADWPVDFYARSPAEYVDHQIGETFLVTGLMQGETWNQEITWELGSSFAAGDELVLLATVDSPEDPVPVVSPPPVIPCAQFVGSTNNADSAVVVVPQPPQSPVGPVGCASMR
jgi:hypothetical protein